MSWTLSVVSSQEHPIGIQLPAAAQSSYGFKCLPKYRYKKTMMICCALLFNAILYHPMLLNCCKPVSPTTLICTFKLFHLQPLYLLSQKQNPTNFAVVYNVKIMLHPISHIVFNSRATKFLQHISKSGLHFAPINFLLCLLAMPSHSIPEIG